MIMTETWEYENYIGRVGRTYERVETENSWRLMTMQTEINAHLRSIDDEQTLNRVEKKIGLRRQEEDKNVLYTNVSLYRNVAE